MNVSDKSNATNGKSINFKSLYKDLKGKNPSDQESLLEAVKKNLNPYQLEKAQQAISRKRTDENF